MARRTVDIGGVELEAVVAGRGSVTVVFESGLATALEIWDAIAPSIEDRARTLRYDRRRPTGTGAVVPRSHSEMLADLEKLLAALAIAPPYVLVGHSWGGVIARLFAHAHPSDVAGLVFVDATNEALDARTVALLPAMYSVMSLLGRATFARRAFVRQLCPPSSPPGYRARIEERLLGSEGWDAGLRTAKAEGAAIPGALAQLRRECPDLPRIPIQVLTAGRVNTKSGRRVHEAWKALVARAADAHYTDVPASSHNMPIDAPDAVIRAITGVLESLQTGPRLGL
jgi:pimeloyl-ACP methyl ester carboxylesterase